MPASFAKTLVSDARNAKRTVKRALSRLQITLLTLTEKNVLTAANAQRSAQQNVSESLYFKALLRKDF